MLSYSHALRAHKLNESVTNALVLDYAESSSSDLGKAYANVAKGLAVVEETPRGNLGPALRQHLNVIVAEQQRREEVPV